MRAQIRRLSRGCSYQPGASSQSGFGTVWRRTLALRRSQGQRGPCMEPGLSGRISMVARSPKARLALCLFAVLACSEPVVDSACPRVLAEARSWQIESIYGDPSIFRATAAERAYVLTRDQLQPFFPAPGAHPAGIRRVEPGEPLEVEDPLAAVARSLEERCGLEVTIGHRLPEIAPEPD